MSSNLPTLSPALRPGERADIETMALLHARCWSNVFGEMVPPEVAARVPAQSREQFAGWFRTDSEACVTIAEIDGRIVGYAGTDGPQLVHLFVDPDRSRRGVGRTLLADAEARIATCGHPIAELHTRVGNEPAIALYRSAGWELTDELVPCEDHGVLVDEHVMIKRVRSD